MRHAQARVLAPGAHREGELIVAFATGTSDAEMERVAPRGRRARARRSRYGPRVLAKLEPRSGRGRGGGAVLARARRRLGRAQRARRDRPGARPSTRTTRLYRFQWNLTQVDAERTWGIQKGQPSVAVAVLDTGIAYEDYGDPNTGQLPQGARLGRHAFLPGLRLLQRRHPRERRRRPRHARGLDDRRGHQQRRGRGRARLRLRDHAGEGARTRRASAPSSTSPTGSTSRSRSPRTASGRSR